MHYPTFPHSHSSMATLIGGGDSESSDTDSSSSSSSSSSGSNTDINDSLIKSYGECSKEKGDSNKEGPKRSTKKEQGTINKNTKSDKVKEERKEAEKETEKASEKEKTKATKSIKLIKRIIAKNKSRTSKVNKKLNLVLKTVSAEQRHNKAALRKTRKIASLASKKTK